MYGFGSTLVQNVLGLSLALFLNSEFWGRSALRAVILMTPVNALQFVGISMVIYLAGPAEYPRHVL